MEHRSPTRAGDRFSLERRGEREKVLDALLSGPGVHRVKQTVRIARKVLRVEDAARAIAQDSGGVGVAAGWAYRIDPEAQVDLDALCA